MRETRPEELLGRNITNVTEQRKGQPE